MRISRISTLLCLLLLTLSANAESPSIKKWKMYQAKQSPTFKMIFPGKVKVQKGESGYSYTSSHRWPPLLGTRVTVTTGALEGPASDIPPQAAMKIFTNDAKGKVKGKRIL